MSSTPGFASTPAIGVAQISTANTNRNGTGQIDTVLTAGASGSRISRIHITATSTTTAGVVRLFIHDGSSARLWHEVLVSAITPSTSVAVFQKYLSEAIDTDKLPLILETGESLRASTHNAETFNVEAFGGDY